MKNQHLFIRKILVVILFMVGFTATGGQINLSFTRDDKGKIAGFVFNSGVDEREVKGIVFKRQ